MTPLDKPVKRALKIDGRDYVITIDPRILKITEKGRRIGLELKWAEIVSGETALAVALQASLGKFQSPKPNALTKASTKASRPTKKRVPKKR
jgi:hypothetical protein